MMKGAEYNIVGLPTDFCMESRFYIQMDGNVAGY